MNKLEFSLSYLADKINARVEGDGELAVSGLATLQNAGGTELSFLANPAYEKYLSDTEAGAVILTEAAAAAYSGNKLIHDNPYQAYAELSHLWAFSSSKKVDSTQIHPSAHVDGSASLGQGVRVGPGVVIEPGVVIADNVQLGANVYVGEESRVGEGTLIYANVSIYHGVTIGAACILHSGVVIGSDGFGFSPGPKGWTKIEQLGGVVIGKNVEIGANTTIDRGALDNTKIGNGVILDNQIQIAHNVVIGDGCAIAACSAIAGSTTLGKNVIVGGASGIAGHLHITDGVHITAMTMVIKSLNEPGVYSSGTGVQPNAKWRKSIARLRQLDKMAGRVSALEKQLKQRGEG